MISSGVMTMSESPIKVALIMGKMNPGGKKTLALQYFMHANKEMTEYHFICDSDSFGVPEDEIINAGGFVHYIAPYQNIVANMRDMKSLFEREKFDIVHAYNSTMNVFPMYVAKRASVPVRISESLSMAHEREFKTLIKKILRPTSRLFATNYMACGEDCGRWQFGQKMFDAGKVDVFKTAIDSRANAFDPHLREVTRSALGVEDRFVIGFIGRFAEQKNPLFMIEIFKHIHELNDNAVLLLIGDGVLKDKMLEAVHAAQLEESVLYLGLQEDIVRFYQAMDCFLLPSLYEGLPVVGLEAQCSGLPVFFSDTITREASFCDLGHFLSIEAPPQDWASVIVENHEKRSLRRDMSALAASSGFDSREEALRLQDYYFQLLRNNA